MSKKEEAKWFAVSIASFEVIDDEFERKYLIKHETVRLIGCLYDPD